MDESPFDKLGIQPTTDERVIHEAFLRLARIYHPDRFTGMPDDVRSEAERRMKEAAAAYETLRTKRAPRIPLRVSKMAEETWERARRGRLQDMAERREEEERARARWRLWDELDRQARERAEWEAAMGITPVVAPETPSKAHDVTVAELSPPAPQSELARRLQEVKGSSRRPLRTDPHAHSA